ncbi:serine hydrolase domain-containing protein [uncultured Dokdonia sp.]|uniref:serine hydrolase domain-containing protein n=1 Tax=uncultured Dokdonia sp. TaxID=575653 RepID=UPI00260B9C4A|nr:serine hydrolase domain-containing protein [uncultured Dokdonia sp.]
MKFKSLFLSVFLVFAFAKAVSGQIKTPPTHIKITPELAAQVDAVFADTDKADHPGAALGIFKDGEIIYAKGYGYANLEYDIPISSTSVFRIASTSKQFTAACIVLLAQQGKLSLDATLDTFLPAFPSYAKTITVRHLLNHTSGIRDYLTLASLSGLGDEDFYTDQDVMKWLINQEELNFKPGDEHLYSNSGYWLLGQIVQKVTGTSMADYAQKEIFKPLGMNNTHFHNDYTAIVKNRASGYSPTQDGGFQISMTTLNMIGDGGIFTTIEDVKKWDDAYYNSTVLTQNFWKTMTTTTILNDGTTNEYASGLEVGLYDGHKIISHGGAFVGFRAQKFQFPDKHFTVVVLANRGDANPDDLASKVTDLFLDPIETSTHAEDAAVSNSAFAKANSIKIPTADLKKLEGSYWGADSKISRNLTLVNDTLVYDRGNGRITKMEPISKNTFRWIGPNIPIKLTIDNPNKPSSFILDIPGQGVSNFQKYEPVTQLTPEQIQRYEGDYYSKELDVTYTFKNENNQLTLYVNGESFSSVEPIMKDVFSVFGFITFDFAKDQQSFRTSAGRVQNLHFVKK